MVDVNSWRSARKRTGLPAEPKATSNSDHAWERTEKARSYAMPAKTLVYKVHTANIVGTISTRVPEDLKAELEAYPEAECLEEL